MKVSIITPLFNAERYVHRFLDSILGQSYKNIQLIFINDGSTDRTEEVVKSYQDKLVKEGVEFKYVHQIENIGVAGTINIGLKLFDGDYLIWPDADDRLEGDSIERRVEFLNNNSNYGLVRSTANVFDEKDLNHPIGLINHGGDKENIFDSLINETVYCLNGCYMVRSKAFLDVNPKREIYPSRVGQNWQMLLPITYKYKCGFIDAPLYDYTIRPDSLYHRVGELKNKLERCEDYIDILTAVISTLDTDKAKYYRLIDKKYAWRRFDLAMEYNNYRLASRFFVELIRKPNVTTREVLGYIKHNMCCFLKKW